MAEPATVAPRIDLSGVWIALDPGYLRELPERPQTFIERGARGLVLDLSLTKDPSEAWEAFSSLMSMVDGSTEVAVRMPAEGEVHPAIAERATFVAIEPPLTRSDSEFGRPLDTDRPLLVAFVASKFSNVQEIVDYYAAIDADGVYWTEGEVLDLSARVQDFGPVPLSVLLAPRPPGRESPISLAQHAAGLAYNGAVPVRGLVLNARWQGLIETLPQLNEILAEQSNHESKSGEELPDLEVKKGEEPEAGDAKGSEESQAASVAVSDTYTTKDTLGYDVYAGALSDFAAHPDTMPPLAIGIMAAWGMGKTSLMRQVEARFAGVRERKRATGKAGADSDIRKPFRTVWVDVWRYENSAALWASLAEEVYQQTARQMGWWERQKFRMALDTDWADDWPRDSVLRLKNILRRRAKKAIGLGVVSAVIPAVAVMATGFGDWLAGQLSNAAAIIGLPVAIAATAAGVTLTGLGALRDTLTREIKRFASPPENSEQVTYSKKSEDQIHRLVKILSRPEEGIRLAIFIDDLDRCSPDRVVDVVESINLLFSQTEGAGAVFFVGLDADMVAASIEVAYGATVKELKARGNQAGNDFGYHFLQKILQMTFIIPPPLPHHVEGFLDSLLGVEEKAKPDADTPATPPASEPGPDVQAALTEVRAQTNIAAVQAASQSAQAALPAEERAVVREEAAQVALDLLRTDSTDVQRAIREGVRFLEPRPRNYKRFLNAFRLQVIISSRAEGRAGRQAATLDHIAKWTALQLRWPVILEEARAHDDLFSELEPLARSYEDARRKLMELQTRAGGSNGATPPDQAELTRASESLKRAYEALPPRVRSTGDFDRLIEVMLEEPYLAGVDLHGLVLV